MEQTIVVCVVSGVHTRPLLLDISTCPTPIVEKALSKVLNRTI